MGKISWLNWRKCYLFFILYDKKLICYLIKGIKLFGITGYASYPMIIESLIGTPLNQLIEESKPENIVTA